MRRFGPPYPTHDWDARLTIGELCSHDDPRGMLAWAVLNYDPHKRDEQDVDDQLAGLFVEIYARLTGLESGLTSEREDVKRLLDDTARVSEIVTGATGVVPARRSA
jgi:hypothetical protein